MTKKLAVLGLSVLLCAGAATSGYAWNNEGHMMVAYVAYKKLTPTARDRANALLKLNPKYSDWLATLPAGDLVRG